MKQTMNRWLPTDLNLILSQSQGTALVLFNSLSTLQAVMI